jgi:hypothetical protein
MNTAAKFSNNVEISGNIDISGNINLNGTLTVDGSFSLYGYHIPDPIGENSKVLTISGDGYSWETVDVGDELINSAGQTFYEIITEQPRAFTAETMSDGTLFDNTISSIDIAWNFDELIPTDASHQHLNITGDLNQRVLPCITDIYFEISSNEASYSNTIIATKSISVSSSHNYNSDSYNRTGSFNNTSAGGSTTMNYTLTYKTLNLSITGQDTNSYTVSIYGQNNSNDSTTINKLTYTGLVVQATGIAKVPTITSITDSMSGNAISFTINANTTDMDVTTDDTVLSSALYVSQLDLSHTLIDSVRSGTAGYGLPAHTASDISTDITDANNSSGSTDSSGNETISISPTYSSANGVFYLGSKYTMQARIYNLLNSSPTDYSDSADTSYSDIPTSSTSNNNTDNPFNGDPSLVNSSSKALLDYGTDNVYNLSNLTSDARINPSTTGTRYVEISNPNSDINDTSGYGKYIDGSENMISINCLLYFNDTDVSLQQVDYHGWGDTYTSDVSNNNIVPFGSLSVSDMYSSNQQKGFRRWAEFSTDNHLFIVDLSDAGFIQPFNPYNVSKGYELEYNLTRTDVYTGGSGTYTRTSSDFYVDNFPNYAAPSYNTSSSSVVVTGITWVMGIPQVSTADILFTRNHTNINSQYKYFQTGGLVANVNTIYVNNSSDSDVEVYSSGTKNYLSLTYSDLNADGSYNGSFDGSLNYSAIDSQSSNKVSSLDVNSTVYNLYTNISTDETFSVAHYRDADSISNYASVFTSSSTNRIYELSYNTVADLGSNFYNVHTGLDVYDNSNHEKEIQSYTLPFISGSFTVDDSSYPDICGDFDWDGTLSTTFNNSVYDNRATGIDLDGNSGDYKCIVYKVNTSDNQEYGTTTTYGVNLSYIANRLFGSTMETTLRNIIYNGTPNNVDILVYIVGYSTTHGSNVFGVINDGNGSTNSFEGGKAWYAHNSFSNNNTPLSSLNGTATKVGARITDDTSPKDSTIISNNSFSNVNSRTPAVIYVNSDTTDMYLYFFLKI